MNREGPAANPAIHSRKHRILVATASRRSSTAEIGRFLGEGLANGAVQVEIKSLAEVDDLKAYDQVILGSTIRYDR